jgi:hypothetical protein
MLWIVMSRLGRSSFAGEVVMLNPATLVAAAVGQHFAEGYRRAFGEQQPRYALVLDDGACPGRGCHSPGRGNA